MVFDNEEDKKLLLYIIGSYPMEGPYGKVGRAVKELDTLTIKVKQAMVMPAIENRPPTKLTPVSDLVPKER